MREIIFRGKAKHNNDWYFGYLNYSQSRKEYYIMDDVSSFPISAHEETIGQYTVLKDKNGTKIFEGDIIVLSNDNIKGEIIFNEKLSAFQLRYLGELRELFEPKFLGEWITCYSIIGNIHNNPELLEKR